MKDIKLDTPNLTMEEAIIEAKRCLNCKRPLCKNGCPIQNDIPEFIKAFLEEDFAKAFDILSNKTNLPAVCGKICDHQRQCQGSCVLGIKGKPVNIGKIENFIANYAYENNLIAYDKKENIDKKVAIIGSGPAGLSCAYILAKEGVTVDIYEMEDKAGGLLSYGIPRFRLDDVTVARELEKLKNLGVTFLTNKTFNKDFTINSLKEDGYSAIFISIGANSEKSINIEGESLEGVIHANKFLVDFAKGKDTSINNDDVVLVIGGGNVSMDSSRTAKLLTDNVTVVYRRTEKEMPASKEEYEEALKDGVNFMFRYSPIEFIGEGNKLTGLKVKNLDTEEISILPCSIVLTAIGSSTNIPDNSINLNDKFLINTDESGMTNLEGVFSAGDVVSGPNNVVSSMRDARKVALNILEYLKNN